MIGYGSVAAIFCLGLTGLVVSSLIILALIPLYIPPKNLVPSYADNRTYSFQANFSLKNPSFQFNTETEVDSLSLPVIQKEIQNVLYGSANLPRAVSIVVEGAAGDQTNAILYVGGNFLFSPICNQECQNRLINDLYGFQSRTQSPSILTLSISDQITVSIQRVQYNLMLTGFTLGPQSPGANIMLTYNIILSSPSGSRRLRRDITISNNNPSLVSLVGQTLSQSDSLRTVPFVIESAKLISLYSNIQLSQLVVSVLVQFVSIVCFQGCQKAKIDDFNSFITQGNITVSPSFSNGPNSYSIIDIPPLINNTEVVPPSLQTAKYSVDSNSSNFTLGPVTDPTALNSIAASISTSLNSSVDVLSANIVSESSSSSKMFRYSLTRRNRRQIRIVYFLVVVIRLHFGNRCNYRCQIDKLQPIASMPLMPLAFVIGGVSISCRSQGPIQSFGTTTTVAPPTTTTTTTRAPNTANVSG